MVTVVKEVDFLAKSNDSNGVGWCLFTGYEALLVVYDGVFWGVWQMQLKYEH